ncbi:MAG: hypothetical protein U9O85_05935 [Euryarchaeota archaeon]|nr:hypothetical protein [Euryarchaeota archaeon]
MIREEEMEALKFYAKISEEGRIELPELGKLKGRRAEIIILPLVEEEEFENLFMASESSLDFWDNSIDDEIWNDA